MPDALTPRYVTADDLNIVLTAEQLIQLTDDTGPGDAIDTDTVNNYLAYAEATAETYVQGRYALPIGTGNDDVVPLAFKWAILTLAKYRLLLRREYATETVTEEYTEAMAWLVSVKGDEIDLYEPVTDEDAESDTVFFGNSTNPVFDDSYFL